MTEGTPVHWHRVPTRLTDGLMPRLKDTELRVLLVVLRATWGWRAAPDAPATKRREWLSHAQLCRRTGRGSEAVSGAIDALVRSGLLAVEDAAGRPLATPAERRRHLGRLYYRAGDALLRAGTPDAERREEDAERRETAGGQARSGTEETNGTAASRRRRRGASLWKNTSGMWKSLGPAPSGKTENDNRHMNNR